MSSVIKYFANFFTKGHEQSIEIKKNVFFSFILKGLSLILGLLYLPLILSYISKESYGVWLTLSSVIGWLAFFDIGLGNGLRNKFTESVAKKKIILAKTYVSTTYAVLTIITSILFISFFFINPLLNWVKILNAPSNLSADLPKIVIVTFLFFCIRFVVKLIGTILVADQKIAINNSFNLISKIISLILIVLLIKFTKNSLLYLVIIVSGTPVIVLILANFIFFNTFYKQYRPSFQYIDFKHFKNISNLGFKFFFIQAAAIILFTTDNMIITQILGPAEVTRYNVAHKYFYTIFMLFSIIMRPFWSAYTKAYFRKDFEWIKRMTKKMLNIGVIISILIVLMVFISNFVYRFWLRGKIEVPILLSALMGFSVIVSVFAYPFVSFINGVGKIKLSLYLSFITVTLNIPLSIYFAKTLNMGSAGVILATSVCNVSSVIISSIQYNKIINNKAKGIWNK